MEEAYKLSENKRERVKALMHALIRHAEQLQPSWNESNEIIKEMDLIIKEHELEQTKERNKGKWETTHTKS